MPTGPAGPRETQAPRVRQGPEGVSEGHAGTLKDADHITLCISNGGDVKYVDAGDNCKPGHDLKFKVVTAP